MTPKITLLSIDQDTHVNDADISEDDEIHSTESEKCHPLTTDSFRPKHYQ